MKHRIKHKGVLFKVYLVIFSVFIAKFAYAEKKYAIFVDAGTTGTRLFVFEYLSTQRLATSLPQLTEIHSNKTSLSIASYITHKEELFSYLKPIFDSARFALKEKNVHLSNVDVYFLGTAGMRFLRKSKQDEIYAAVREILEKNYEFHVQKIETISGAMEGVYSWIDVNYLLKNFTKSKSQSTKMLSKTEGILDMGSGSTQIVFATKGYQHSPDEITFTINKKKYIILSKNFLGLGQDAAREQMNLYENSGSCYPNDFQISPEKKGHFNLIECLVLYHEILEKHHLKRGQIPTHESTFVGINGFYYTFDFFEMLQSKHHAGFEAKIDKTCSKTWTQFESLRPWDKHLSEYCANGVYTLELIYHTYQIRNNQLNIVNKIHGQSLNWTRGAALYHLFDNG